MKGTHGNAGPTPTQVADKLRGRSFNNFDEFREAYWQAVADTPELSKQFSASNLGLMRNGKSPVAHPNQWLGKNNRYNLHHRTPINQGGAVYAVDNILVTTPRYHKEILDPDYHYSK